MVKAAILVTVDSGKVGDVAEKVRALEHITDVLTVSGRADMVALCEGTFEDIWAAVRKVGEIDVLGQLKHLLSYNASQS
jgi:hypothetical protein